MRLIDADELEERLKKKMQLQTETALEYDIMGGTFVNLQTGIMQDVLELVRAQPTAKEYQIRAMAERKGMKL